MPRQLTGRTEFRPVLVPLPPRVMVQSKNEGKFNHFLTHLIQFNSKKELHCPEGVFPPLASPVEPYFQLLMKKEMTVRPGLVPAEA